MKQVWIALAAVTVLAACSSSSKGSAAPDENTPDCICGTPEESFHGCPHPMCVSGEGNPDNHDCVCGALSIEE